MMDRECIVVKEEQQRRILVDLKGENEYLGLGVSLGNVPMYHGTKLKVLDRKVRITELMLKCVSHSLRVVAIVLMVIDSQVKEFFSFQKKAKLTDMKALVCERTNFWLLLNSRIVLCCVVNMVRGNVLFSKPLAWPFL
ncbi:CASP-like protein 2B1 [Glycine soja]